MKGAKFWRLVGPAFHQAYEDNLSMLAAALSFYALFSLAPLLIILTVLTGRFLGENWVQQELLTQINSVVGDQSTLLVKKLIAAFRQPKTGLLYTLFSFLLIFYGATNIFIQLQKALQIIWGVSPAANRGIFKMLKSRLLTFLVILLTGFLLFITMLGSTALSGLGSFFPGRFAGYGWIHFFISFLVTALLFSLLYFILPGVQLKFGDVVWGGILTAFFFTLGNSLIGLYLGSSGVASVYGAASSLAAILVWFYYSTLIFLLGAEFVKLYTRSFGSLRGN